MGRIARMLVLAWLAAGCLETPGASSDGGPGAPDGAAPPGSAEWQFPLGASLPYIAIDEGELTAVAGFVGTIDALDPPVTASAGGDDLLIAGFSADGKQRFAEVYGGVAREFATAVTVSPVSGDISVVGLYSDGGGNVGGEALPEPTSGFHLFAARYDPGGGHLWSLPGVAAAGVHAGFALSMSGSGELALSGDYSAALMVGDATASYAGPGPDLYFARVSAEGSVPALVVAGADGDQIGAGALFDGLGSLYLFGTQTGPFVIDEFSPDSDADGGLFVCQIDETGTDASWLFDSVGGRVGSLRGAVDRDGALLLTGWFDGTFAFDVADQEPLTSRGGSDVFIARIEPDGSVDWVVQFGGPGDEEPRGIAAGPDGTFAITGLFHGGAGLGEGEPLVTSKGGADIFLLSFAADRSLRWAHGFGDGADDAGFSVAVDADGAVVLAAIFRGEVDFGAGEPLSAGGDSEAALVRFR